MHPSGFTDDVKGVKKSSQGKKIIKEMFTYVWPKDNPEIKARVVLAVSLLLGAKVFVCKGTWFFYVLLRRAFQLKSCLLSVCFANQRD